MTVVDSRRELHCTRTILAHLSPSMISHYVTTLTIGLPNQDALGSCGPTSPKSMKHEATVMMDENAQSRSRVLVSLESATNGYDIKNSVSRMFRPMCSGVSQQSTHTVLNRESS